MKIKSITLNVYYLSIVTVYLLFLLNSCTPVKNVVYFQNLEKDTTLRSLVSNDLELKIRKNDLLSINIVAAAEDVALFNAGGTGGYLVDNNGDIVMYKLGIVHVEGLTRSELKRLLQKEHAPYLLNPVLTIRYLSNHVTILGEVGKPQVLSMPNEQITLLDAIGQSGDLTFTGRRDNVLVIRETPEGKQFKRINLNDNSIFYSPFYYLKPDDVVYVEPTKLKIKTGTTNTQTISYALTAFSVLITVYSLLRR
jgi:polysaccharide export outer membrane protein